MDGTVMGSTRMGKADVGAGGRTEVRGNGCILVSGSGEFIVSVQQELV